MRSQTPERAVLNAYTPAAARTPGSREQKAWSQAQSFEQVFLNTMFGQMFTGIGTESRFAPRGRSNGWLSGRRASCRWGGAGRGS